jgi:hypothetical protein
MNAMLTPNRGFEHRLQVRARDDSPQYRIERLASGDRRATGPADMLAGRGAGKIWQIGGSMRPSSMG